MSSSKISPSTSIKINYPVLIGSSIGVLGIGAWCVVSPSGASSALSGALGWITEWFGWFYIALATAILAFVIFLAISRYGRVKLGPEHSRPEFSNGAWTSMLFAAGIGTDLMFFAVNEPVTQYLAPPATEPQSVDAAREATVWTMFHYGISGWGMYALMGMALGYFAYRLNLPLAIRSALYPIIGKRVQGPIGTAVDLAAVLGTIFGVATSLGIAVVGLNVGLNLLFGVPQGLAAQIVLIVLGVGMATVSAVSGVDKGIKLLSQLNVITAVGLAVFILLTGRTSFLLNALVLNIGDYIRLFPNMTMQTFAFQDNADWLSTWTLFFWAWWVAWSAFVGLFLARISRGRTIRQFVAGTLVMPFTYIVMWVGIFGNAAIDQVRQGNAAFGEVASSSPENGFYALLQQYPAFPVVALLATFVGLLFYVTSADSGALVMANLCSELKNPQQDGGRRMRIYWAVLTGALTIAILSVGGISSLQQATVIMGLPFAIVLVLVMIGLWRALRVEGLRDDIRSVPMPGLLSGRSSYPERGKPAPWKSRLLRVMNFPDRSGASDYLTEVAQPALREVAEELSEQGIAAQVSTNAPDPNVEEADDRTETGQSVTLTVPVGTDAATPFQYRVAHIRLPVPSYGRWAIRGNDEYSRLEVYLADGGQGYDVMGYSHAQLIDDVLDQYERHLEFLRANEVNL